MAYVIIEHKIGQRSEFEQIFSDDAERRRRLGSKGGRVFFATKEPGRVLVVFEWQDPESALRFAEGLETHEAVKWATSGVWHRIWVSDEVLEVDF